MHVGIRISSEFYIFLYILIFEAEVDTRKTNNDKNEWVNIQ